MQKFAGKYIYIPSEKLLIYINNFF